MTAISHLRPRAHALSGGFIARLLAVVALFHVALAVLLPDLEGRFQLGDRAWDRAMKLDALLGQTSLDGMLTVLFRYDAPGDYILFLPAYGLFGAPGVIAQNILLLMLGTFYLFRFCQAWFSPTVARIATIAWLALPATIFHPHVLVSEAICDPVLIIATYYAAQMLGGERLRMPDAVKFGLAAAILCFVRPFYLLLPLMVAGLLIVREERFLARLGPAVVICTLSLSLAGLWQAALFANNGRYKVEPSFHGLASNLYLRAERAESVGGFKLSDETRLNKTMPPGAFLELALARPLEIGRTYISDAINLAGNTGVNMVHGRFLGLFDLGERSDADVFKWRDVRDREGMGAMLALLWQNSPRGLLFNFAAVAIWVGILALAAWGFLSQAANIALPALLRLVVALVPAYVILFCFVSGSVRWDHRSPAEFAICIFMAIGIVSILGRAPLARHHLSARRAAPAGTASSSLPAE